MTPAKLDLCVVFFSYGGNGGTAQCLPHLRRWWAAQFHALAGDPRIGRISEADLSDTPITMTRNRALRLAKESKADLLLMIDSDNVPDLYVGKDPGAKPFLASSIDFAYQRLLRGVPTMIAAPYCGPPPHPTEGGYENVYVFAWENAESDVPGFAGSKVIFYDRDRAALMTGIAPAAALPTGVMLLTTNILDALPPPYFRYEWTDKWESEKASTEDVYFSRNIAMAGIKRWGENVVFCNWDSWAGHYKPKCVGKPTVLRVEQVADVFAEAVRNNYNVGDKILWLDPERPPDFSATAPAEKLPDQPAESRCFDDLGCATSVKDLEVLQELVRSLGDHEVHCLEVGSWCGASAMIMCNANPKAKVTCVDHFQGTPTDRS